MATGGRDTTICPLFPPADSYSFLTSVCTHNAASVPRARLRQPRSAGYNMTKARAAAAAAAAQPEVFVLFPRRRLETRGGICLNT